MATLTIKSARCATTIRMEAIAYDRIPAGVEERKVALSYLIDANGWTLEDYLAWLNRPEPGVVKGDLMPAADWQEAYGITTASQLGEYLDGCFQREVEKGRFSNV